MDAARWFVRIQAGALDDIDRLRFREWLQAHPLHRIEYDKLDLIWVMAPSAEDLAAFETSMRRAATFSWRLTDAWRDAVCPSALASSLAAIAAQSTAPMVARFSTAVPAFLL